MKFIAGAVLLCLASAASAATTLVGGGATLPLIGYTSNTSVPLPFNAPVTPAAGSLFFAYGGNPVTYCGTGSGAGKKILAGNDPANFQVNAICNPTPPIPPALPTTPVGFGPAAGTTLTQAHFAGSDAPLSSTEYANYVTGHGTGTQPTQLPAIAGAVGIAFKKTGVNALTLTEGQICGIFSGQIKTWDDAALAGAGIPSGTTGNINVVYRSDGSGTSFSFLNHLSDVCQANVAPGKAAALNFKTNQSYVTGATSYIASYASSLPAGGASGNAGVAAGVGATDGSVGYAEVANGVPAGVRIASVKNTAGTVVNPLTGFGPTAIGVAVTFDKAIADTVDSQGRPTLATLPASNGCIGLVDPLSYSNLANSTLPGGGASAYPIVAITNLLGNAQGNGVDAAAVAKLLASPYDTTIRSSVTKIGRAGTGYAWLSSTDLTAARVTSCIH